jgi:hypothetical protein
MTPTVNKTRIGRDLFLCTEQKLDATDSPVTACCELFSIQMFCSKWLRIKRLRRGGHSPAIAATVVCSKSGDYVSVPESPGREFHLQTLTAVVLSFPI